MSLDLFQDEATDSIARMAPVEVPEPAIFQGFFRGAGMRAMRNLARAGRTVDALGAIGPILEDKLTGTDGAIGYGGAGDTVISTGTEAQDRYFREGAELYGRAIDYWTPKPGEVGIAGEILGDLVTLLPMVVASPSFAVAESQIGIAQDLMDQGLDAKRAQAVGAIQAVGLGTGIWMPILGKNLWQRAVVGGAGYNLVQGVGTRYASALAIGLDDKMAAQFRALDPTALTLDVLLGLGFGGWAHLNPASRQQGKEAWERIHSWAGRLEPEQVAAVAVARQAQHLNEDSLPGKPVDAEAIQAHVARTKEAVEQVVATGEPARVDDLPAGRFEPDPARLEEATARADELVAEGEAVRAQEGLAPPQEPDPAGAREVGDLTRLPRTEQAAEIGRRVQAQLELTGMNEAEAKVNASLWTEFFRTAQQKYGMEPASILAEHGIDIRRLKDAQNLVGALEQATRAGTMGGQGLAAPRLERTPEGAPELIARDVHITRGAFFEGTMVPAGTKITESVIVDPESGKGTGRVTLQWKGDKVAALLWINSIAGQRKRGMAERTVRAILEHNGPEARELHIQEIVKDARPFWEKLGVEFVKTETGEDGFLTLERYRTARPAQSAQGEGAGAGAGAGRAGDSQAQAEAVIPAELPAGAKLYHGTQSKFDQLKGIAYLTADPAEAAVFARGEIPGTVRGPRGEPMVVEVTTEGRLQVKDIDEAVQGEVMEGGDLDALIKAELERAGQGGYGAVAFRHPSGKGGGEFTAIVPVHPHELKVGAATDARTLFQAGREVTRTQRGRAGISQRQFQADMKRVLETHGEDRMSGRNSRVSTTVAEQLAREGHPDAGPAAVAAYASDDFSQYTTDTGVELASTRALIDYVNKMEPVKTGPLYRVLGFSLPEDVAQFVRYLKRAEGGTLKSERPVMSFTTESPKGRSPMEHIGMDLSELGGDQKVVIEVLPRAGESMEIGRDISKLYGDEVAEFDVVVPRDALFKFKGTRKEGEQTWITLEPRARASGDVTLFQRQPIFYSALARQIDAAKMKQAPAQGWKDYLKGITAKGAVKAEEIKWSELNEWLDLQQAQSGKVTKEQIQVYLKQKGVKVEEVIAGGPTDRTAGDGAIAQEVATLGRNGIFVHQDPPTGEAWAFLDIENNEFNNARALQDWATRQQGDANAAAIAEAAQRVEDYLMRRPGPATELAVDAAQRRLLETGYRAEFSQDGEEVVALTRVADGQRFSTDPDWTATAGELSYLELPEGPVEVAATELFEAVLSRSQHGEGQPQPVGTKFGQYQLPGGKNYREIRLILPHDPEALPKGWRVQLLAEPRGGGQKYELIGPAGKGVILSTKAVDDATAHDSAMKYLDTHGELDKGTFRESHWDEKNVLAHVRFNERTDAEGKRTLFIEEIQSDWAQKGKKRGFADAERLKVVQDRLAEMRKVDASKDWTPELEREETALLKERDSLQSRDIPAAPFVGKTEAWVGLTLKRMIRYAAEHGFERVAWTTGEQQVSRYTSALRKAVDSIDWKKTPEGIQIIGYKGAAGGPDRGTLQGLRGDVDDILMANANFGFDTRAEARQAILDHADWQDRWGDGVSTGGRTMIGNWRRLALSKTSRTKVVDTTEKEDALSDAIGKTMADRIIADPAQEGTIEGEGIRVDDTGMGTFYGKIVPNVANDILKKLGGGRVGEVKLTFGTPKTVPDQASLRDSNVAPAAMQMPELRQFDEGDWSAFSGAVPFVDGAPPLIAETQVKIHGAAHDVMVIVDRYTVHVVGDGFVFGIRPRSAQDRWAHSQKGAISVLDLNWTSIPFWQDFSYMIEGELPGRAGTPTTTSPGFDITPQMRTEAMKGLPMFQRGEGGAPAQPKGAIQFGEERTLIALFENADRSTFVHESGHFFLEATRAMAARADAPENLKADWASVQDWLGLKEGAPIPTEAHEQFARGFEAYLRNGQAPTPELKSVFQQFKEWLLAIYREITDLGVELAPEVQAIYDRMLTPEPRAGVPRAAIEDTPEARKTVEDYQKQIEAGEDVGPILVDRANPTRVIDGNHRLTAMDALSVPAEIIPVPRAEATALLTAGATSRETADALTGRPAMPAPTEGLYVEWGGQRHQVASLDDAAAKWSKFRDETGEGVSGLGNGVEVKNASGEPVARISYNGRIWPTRTEGPAAKGETPVPPPPRRGEPEATGPEAARAGSFFDEDFPRPKTEVQTLTIDDPKMKAMLEQMAENEAGWAQIGGRLDAGRVQQAIRREGAGMGGSKDERSGKAANNILDRTGQVERTGIPAFTTWIPKAEWWRHRPGPNPLSEAKVKEAVRKAIAGEPLKAKEQATVDYLVDIANHRLTEMAEIGETEWTGILQDLHAAELEPTTKDVVDADAVARAVEVNEGAVERAAMRYSGDDAAFMAEVRSILDAAEQDRQAPRGGQEDSQAPAGRAPGARAPEEGSGEPGAGAEAPDAVTASAERFVVEHPDAVLNLGRDADGTPQTITAKAYLEQARAEAAQAREDAKLFEIAAQCMLLKE